MDMIIRELMAIDQQARSEVHQAEEKQAQEKLRISQEKQDLHAQYVRRVQEKLNGFRQEAEKQFAEEMKRVEAGHQKDLAALETLFKKNESRLVEEIVSKCVGS
jgi:vacuolar-type H+-ATPase subunit H